MISVARSALLVALVTPACVGTATLPQRVACASDENCLPNETCSAGMCVQGAALTSDGTCSSDLDCDIAAGAFCENGVCNAPPAEAPASCSETSECPIDTFCNVASGQCDALLDDWCRVDGQCAGLLCSTTTSTRTGTCVECRVDADCGGLACHSDGTCEEPAPEPVECPANSALVPGSTTVCQCDAGFVPNPATQTCDPQQTSDPDTGTTTCVPNASPVPGVPGQCRCDGGFEPNVDGSACVPIEDTPPPPPPPPNDGGNTGGDTGGNVDDTCGPNSFPLFFVCVCEPGFVVNEFGDGCVAESQSGGGQCPPNSFDGGDGFCYCNDGFVVDASGTQCVPASNGGGSQCPANSSLYSDGYCYCDQGYAPNSSGTACEVDQCAQLGYYGDGLYCDDFCPYYDPDCG